MELPTKIGRYEIRRELGRGMMGVVYEAHDPALGRRIALKTIRLAFAVSDDERRSFEERFLTEARIAARLSHPGIVVVHDVGQDSESGTLYIALEYLVGRTLAEVVAEGKAVDWRETLRITMGVAEALDHAHSEGVIHRDVKPANIMILASGEPKIMDFGIAKVESSQLTAAGQLFGTPLYMSPEQALGRPLDARSDLFSLGAMTYWLLTGKHAFAGTAVPHIITRVIQEDPAPPTHVVRALPPDLDYFIARALSKAPGDRYPRGRAMAEDADDILSSRPPRHRGAWEGAARVDGTVVARASGEPAKERQRPPVPRPGPARPPAAAAARPAPQPALPWVAFLVAALVLGAAVAVGLLALRGPAEPGPAAATMMPPTMAAAPPETLPTSTTLEAARVIPIEPPPIDDAETPTPEPVRPRPRVPPPTTTLVTPLVAAPAAAREPPAQLAVDFEHSLEQGTLRVWVDDALVVEADLDSRVTKKVVVLRSRKGRVEETLELSPGTHEVRVQVAWDDNVKTKHIAGHFASGAIRRLSAKLGGGVTGLVKKDLKLVWE
ncbi:MAG TPA: serine/threonine-protein kinase [Vicinamibacteria bacterium]|nr:serine/threonine-protein kinase [Vicinamibacteria bacterium]